MVCRAYQRRYQRRGYHGGGGEMTEQGFPEAQPKQKKILIPVIKIAQWLKKLFSMKKGKWGWR